MIYPFIALCLGSNEIIKFKTIFSVEKKRWEIFAFKSEFKLVVSSWNKLGNAFLSRQNLILLQKK